MRAVAFGSAIATGTALLAGSLQGMASIDERLQTAAERPGVRSVFISEQRALRSRAAEPAPAECPQTQEPDPRMEL